MSGGMVAVVRVARGAVVAAVSFLGAVGLAMLVQQSGSAVAAGSVGALAGVTVGVVVRWAQEQRVTLVHVLGFAAAGVGAFAAMHAASLAGGWITMVTLVLFGAWWGLAWLEQTMRSDEAHRWSRSTADTVRRLSELEVPVLCAIWEDLRSARVANGRPRPQEEQLRELRQRVLDELERRDPQGFSRWLSSGAVDSPGRFVA
jgi:hypothetical protein